MKPLLLMVLVLAIFSLSEISAAHFIVGVVENAVDGTSANGYTVVLWNPSYGMSDNVTDIVGTTGNSGANNTYMINCGSLSNGCSSGDNLSLTVVESGNHNSANVSVIVSGSGFDIAPTLFLNSPPNITSVTVDDSITTPAGYIDLITNSTRYVHCTALAKDPEGGPLQNLTAVFFSSNSGYSSPDDNNNHYTNSSCAVNASYVSSDNESQIVCGFNVWYYADEGNWTCTFSARDNLSLESNASAKTFVNPLLSVGAVQSINFGLINSFNFSDEIPVNVTNLGNVPLNLSLYGYAETPGDGYAMNCSLGSEIPVYYEKYNLTTPNPGPIGISGFNSDYQNLTSSYEVKRFNLAQRQNDAINDAINTTYWRIYVPKGVGGNCTGKIVFGASAAPGT